ncbi:MAG: amidohydrolase family protein [Caldilineaceae bacterium SB0661_bin_32]|uniref:Amidohydrolase family protein n=1 Tax=Caldilineaceae bacterium SB0661_bin_32 TaxID=2605255 RepID=A0A6B1D6M7_9CHLR|nr:amidohydrolase family protein [Caldilineaceae bacterium SB0661_bin_32]
MSKNACDLLISNGQIVTMDAAGAIFTPGAVAITDSRIVDAGADDELRRKYDAGQTIDAAGAIVHPGFIDAHNHIVHTTCRGVFGNIHDVDASTIKFADWKADVTEHDEADAAAMAAVEMLRSGFTMFIEPGTLFATDAAAGAVERVGMRALFAPPYIWDRRETLAAMPGLESPRLMARAPVDRDRALGLLDAELHRNQDPDALVRGFVFVYGVGTASPELLQAAHACARANNVPLHLHAGYAPGEGEIYRSITGVSQIVHLHELGVLDQNTVIVHANLLDDDEEAAIQASGCQIVWCPISFFSLGIARTAGFRMAARHRRGVPVSLGVDGAFDCTPAELMLAAHLAARVGDDPVSPSDLLEMQTLNAAAAAGLQAELGSLEPGKRADIVIRSPRAAGAYPANNPVHLLALTMGTGSVDTVLVNGEVVLRDGRSTRVDELEISRAVTASVAARAQRLGVNLDSR